MRKCQMCRRNAAEWTCQPFGPDDTVTFTTPGNHYRGFVAMACCDECKQRIQAGETVEATYKGRTVTVQAA